MEVAAVLAEEVEGVSVVVPEGDSGMAVDSVVGLDTVLA